MGALTDGTTLMPAVSIGEEIGRTDAEFAALAGPFRRELLAHCYRLLGSVDDAEDLVQETYLRAWRSYRRFEGRSSTRTWLYRIATNACLSALGHRSRRLLPAGLGAATGRSDGWLQPLPDALVIGEPTDPEAVAVSRESIRLAFVASVQYLPPKQRAVLLLRDVLLFPAADVAEMLGSTVAAVKSSLQRARARLEEVAPVADQVSEPEEPEVRALLDRYTEAFARADAAGLRALLSEDVVLELPPSPAWFRGAAAAEHATAGLGAPGDWKFLPVRVNGGPAAGAYLRGGGTVHRAYGILHLTASAPPSPRVTRITVFAQPSLLLTSALPSLHPA
ncbi:RNA polymerase sigma-70 factor, ECF subfamily [Actinacidiphila yanglinensis]|uniref:RNA polymerase sigma factor n=1 Tax=Actinacidiphila yanglinensis TaxID=310779 RepID=A0A1H5SBC4_9ACTN|nr:RNA polymerase subunit sigma-70 [Actinacidiphila yanglinensis]SEF47121.1 RNA polymerase sigma-70 factor, ECF subfamily [Actinacidiphila yanglinensis]